MGMLSLSEIGPTQAGTNDMNRPGAFITKAKSDYSMINELSDACQRCMQRMYSASFQTITWSSYTDNAQCDKKIGLRLDTGETMSKDVKEYKRYKLQANKGTEKPTASVRKSTIVLMVEPLTIYDWKILLASQEAILDKQRGVKILMLTTLYITAQQYLGLILKLS